MTLSDRGDNLTDMAIFADAASASLRWAYVSLTNSEYRWKFIDCGQLKNNLPACYLSNVSTECYATRTTDNNTIIYIRCILVCEISSVALLLFANDTWVHFVEF